MKKILALFTLLSFCFFLYVLSDTYALFETNGIAVAQTGIGKFQIKVNQVDITGEDASFVIDNFYYEDNENVAEGKIAPGVGGYFDLVFDPSGTDVSIEYSIAFNFGLLTDLPGVSASVTPMNGGDVHVDSEGAYSGIFPLNEIREGKTLTLRVFINWVHDEANNEMDSKKGSVKNQTIQVPITVHVRQYTGN